MHAAILFYEVILQCNNNLCALQEVGCFQKELGSLETIAQGQIT